MNQQPETPNDDWMDEWFRTGFVRCTDCGTRVRCENVTSLPAHNCAQRQRARRKQGAGA